MPELKTNAERNALKATELPAFRGVALAGLKDRVAEMLSMIGRVRELFSTYTKHDISHIESMLRHLDWLIPPSTQKEMTPADWLLITLSVYFHDLGMLVTAEEFDKRMEDPTFGTFLEQIKSDPKSQDYLGRAKKMSEEERQRFFFQEFIRENHPARIKEWIKGRHSRRWGSSVAPIAVAVHELVQPLPARFRENLATVCESHHENNLNRTDLYPLCQLYGNDTGEMANVQFAALILRTADLIHVTKDRTPSIMYKTINFSDPTGVKEWDKQKDTFSVRHVGRTFDPDDTRTHVITVSADFTEEMPFFALTEYLAWADSEIKQTKRWSDQSREHKDASNFWFPWHTIRGDLRVEGNQPQPMRFDFDRGRLLDLLVGHAIYNDPTVAIRELLQNAIDAVRFQHYLDAKRAESSATAAPPIGKVTVSWNTETRHLVVEDNGTGMDLDIVRFHLMRVGTSYYDTPQFSIEHKNFTPISRFGIGILTCFMISDDIEIVTFRQPLGHRIRMTSVHADYLLRELPAGDPVVASVEPHGTRVTLTIREGVDLTKRSVEQILRYWIVLPTCLVEYRERGKAPVRIGYDSPADALNKILERAVETGWAPAKGIEVISKRRDVDGASYEMAIPVQSTWYPERTFFPIRSSEFPSVCIEGICVSESLPGYAKAERHEGNGVALVSVRGVRGLRTTVSRYGLEEDDESLTLGKICCEMIFEHIRDELLRISNETGKPLSRASTAGKWLSSDLFKMVQKKELLDYLQQLLSQLPMMVLEAHATVEGSSPEERRLVTPAALRSIAHFWTIESRLVDSLGIISRDLGREVSLNEFLHALAPDLEELHYSPIVSDAHLFSEHILTHHRAVMVKFNRLYQQTAIQWCPSDKLHSDVFTAITSDEPFMRELHAQTLRLSELEGEAALIGDLPHMGLKPIFVATIAGDDPQVEIVRTRIALLIKTGSQYAQVWDILLRALSWCFENRGFLPCARVFSLRNLFQLAIHGNERQLFLIDRGIPVISHSGLRTPFSRTWEKWATRCNEDIHEFGGDIVFPQEMDFITRDQVFDASMYWLDWHRTKKDK
ncbi:MAG: hypothetical protein CVU57_08945 [Deltaproteobacteria bacterium HGW-Deltaproteobacteria-15]|jgi:hypothetical protein|nr:MAG: hypothetical protein CVU57_08945 [Deltaproteobacteria bacterium HGW-Deltaproteobacteria-15]